MENPFEMIWEKLNKVEEKMTRLEQNKPDQDELMDIDTLGKYINSQKTSIYRLVQKNKIPYIKKGKLDFLKRDIDSWLNRRNYLKRILKNIRK